MFAYTFNEEHKLLIWKQAVQIDIDFMNQWLAELEQLEAQRPPFNRFTDLSQVPGIKLNQADLQQIADRRKNYDGPPVRSVFYAPQPLGFGIGRMYQKLTAGDIISVEVFMNLQSCAHWLDVPQDILAVEPT